MKYTYAYKTSDGVRHEKTMNASSREEVFAELRKQGIKAIKVVAADGSKANGEARGVRIRVVVFLVVLATVCAGLIAFLGGTRTAGKTALDPGTASPRHQIYGDPVLVESLERGEFALHLPRTGDRMLAIFAQPGKLMCPRDFNPRAMTPHSREAFAAYAKTELCPEQDIAIGGKEEREIRELKQIVNGIREEMRNYLANGNGTPRSYWRRLIERTQAEFQIYERTRRELEKETSADVWEQKNDALRRLGLRTIPNPNE